MKRFESTSIAFLLEMLFCTFFAATHSVSCRPVGSDSSALLNLLTIMHPDPRDRTVLIIGDSLTDYSMGFYLPSLISPDYIVHYIGKKGYDFPMWTAVIEEAFSAASPPGHIVVPIGTNDALHRGTEDFMVNLRAFHERLRARSSARIYYCMMPLTIKPELMNSISRNNALLRAESPYDNSEKIDLEAAFSGAPPYPLLYDTDPIHPTQTGYLLIGGRIIEAVTR